MRPKSPTLTPLELAVMQVVWRTKSATVRDAYEALRAKRPLAYTSVMTVMKILTDKGYLTRSLSDRAHVYTPARPRQQVIGALVRDFVDRVFDGAPDALLLHLAKGNTLTPKQRRVIEQLLEEMDQ